MHGFTKVSHNTSATHRIAGRGLAHLKRNAVERAFMGADLVRGDVVLSKPTIKQAAELLKVSPAYVQATIKTDIYRRLSVLQGCEPLIRSKAKKPETLAERFARATPAERVAAARQVGVGVVFDTMVVPALQ
jgi:hypothetical protein